MKDNAVGQIADKLNISISTASKAIRHCSGVDSDTRQSVLDEIRFIKYQPKSACNIYAIIPDTPQYFWREMREGIRKGREANAIPVKCNVYTHLRDESTVLAYLDEAEQLNARAIIISTLVTPKIHDKLHSMTKGRLVLFLSEYHELTNTFFVGADAYMDGYKMGKRFISQYAGRTLVSLTIPNDRNISDRFEGFKRALEEERSDLLQEMIQIKIDRNIFKDPKLLPSKLAPLLADATKGKESLCVYTPFGMSQLPLVFTKAKLAKDTVCMCHDYFADKNEPFITVTCNQDVTRQGELAIELASHYVAENNYPAEKINWVPSILNVM